MPKVANQKLRIMYLSEMLLRQTDETHTISVNEIIRQLREQDISVERKTVYDDIEALRKFGLDIVSERRGRFFAYYIARRDFELSELKLLVDAVASSNFITERKSHSLIKKLEGLTNVQSAKKTAPTSAFT